MPLNLSLRTRRLIYAATLVGTPVALYLRAKGIIGPLELALWGNEVTAAGTLALVNVTRNPPTAAPPAPAKRAG